MARYYGIWNHYGNNVIGFDSLHVFYKKADRDAWNKDDPENKKMAVCSDHPLARRFRNPIDKTHGFSYTLHDHGRNVFSISRDNGNEYADLI